MTTRNTAIDKLLAAIPGRLREQLRRFFGRFDLAFVGAAIGLALLVLVAVRLYR